MQENNASSFRVTLTANGDSEDVAGLYHHKELGWLTFVRHDDADVTAGTTKLQFSFTDVSGHDNLRDIADAVNNTLLTASGVVRAFLPPCKINVNLSGLTGTGAEILCILASGE